MCHAAHQCIDHNIVIFSFERIYRFNKEDFSQIDFETQECLYMALQSLLQLSYINMETKF